MKKTIKTIVGAIILLMGFYSVVTLIQIIFGLTETGISEILLPLGIALIYFLYMVRSRMKDEDKTFSQQQENFSQKTENLEVNNNRTASRYIITASEETCAALAINLKSHPKVLSTFEDTGNWYTNGETGPEWFTVTVEADYKDKETIEELVSNELQKLGRSAGNTFWG